MPERPTHEDWKPDVLSQLIIKVESQQRQINELREKCVTKEDIAPIKAIAYGIVAVFMTAVLMTIAAMAMKGRIAP